MNFKNQLEMFNWIWDNRQHVSELTGKPLLPRNHFQWHWQFLHVLSKKNYARWKLEPKNIILALPEEHEHQERFEVFRERQMKLRREYLEQYEGKIFENQTV